MIAGPDVHQVKARWWRNTLLYVGAGAFSALIAGAVLGAVGASIAPDIRIALATTVGVGAVMLALADMRGNVGLVQCSRETPRSWMLGRRWLAVVRNGVALGCGATTRLGFWSWYIVPISALLLGSAALGAIVYLAYGLARVGSVALWIGAGRAMESRGASAVDMTVWVLQQQPLARVAGTAQLALVGAALAIGSGLAYP